MYTLCTLILQDWWMNMCSVSLSSMTEQQYLKLTLIFWLRSKCDITIGFFIYSVLLVVDIYMECLSDSDKLLQEIEDRRYYWFDLDLWVKVKFDIIIRFFKYMVFYWWWIHWKCLSGTDKLLLVSPGWQSCKWPCPSNMTSQLDFSYVVSHWFQELWNGIPHTDSKL